MKHIVVIVLSVLSGCAVVSPVFYQYAEAPKNAQQEAVLFIADGDFITVKDLDGKELADPYTTWNGGYSAVREIHMLPGVHTVHGRADMAGAFTWYNFSYDFAAGKRYRLVAKAVGYKIVVGPVEVSIN